MERPTCNVKGCNNLARHSHKRKNGEWTWKKDCQTHHRRKYKMKLPNHLDGLRHWRFKKHEAKKKCENCGWDKTYCDYHRIIPGKDGGKYEKGNVIILCPNCHRLAHRGLLKFT